MSGWIITQQPKIVFCLLSCSILLAPLTWAQGQKRYYQYDMNRYESDFSLQVEQIGSKYLGEEYDSIYVPELLFSNPTHEQKIVLAIKTLNTLFPTEYDIVDGAPVLRPELLGIETEDSDPNNTIFVQGALRLIGLNLKLSYLAQGESWSKATVLSDIFLKTFSLKGAGDNGFSGFIFFDDFVEHFSKQDNIELAKKLSQKLDSILNEVLSNKTESEFLANPETATKDLFEVALAIYGDPIVAVKNLGLLMSRDTSVDRYFNYIQKDNSGFKHDFHTIRTIQAIPVKVRAISEALQLYGKTDHDQFSFAGGFQSKDYKSYYYWSGAYFGVRLLEQGFTHKQALIAQEVMIRTYKFLRYYSNYNRLAIPNAVYQISSPMTAGILTFGAAANPLTSAVAPMEVIQYWVAVHTALSTAYLVSSLNFARPKYLKDDLKSTLEMGQNGVTFGTEISCDKIARGIHF